MGSIIYIIGVVLAVLAVLDIIKKPISAIGKVISIVLALRSLVTRTRFELVLPA